MSDEIEWDKNYFEDGRQARRNGLSIAKSPPTRMVGTIAARSWIAGWSYQDLDLGPTPPHIEQETDR